MATKPMQRRRRRTESVDWVEFIVATGFTFVGGWVFMLFVGIVHHEWLPGLPTLGYWPSLLIFFVADLLVTLMRWHARTVPVRSDSTTIYPAK